jgi:hypothetical protein
MNSAWMYLWVCVMIGNSLLLFIESLSFEQKEEIDLKSKIGFSYFNFNLGRTRKIRISILADF